MGVTLSGGEQQMLAIGRALMTNPRLLILDEATEGLAPLIRDEIWNCLSMLKARGQSVLVIDKNVENLTRIADRHYIIERGRAVWSGTSEQLIAEPELQHRYLGDLRGLVVPGRHCERKRSNPEPSQCKAGLLRRIAPRNDEAALKTSRNIRGVPSPTPRPGSARSRRS